MLALLAPVLSSGRTLVFRDALAFGAAQDAVLRAAARRGRLPQWDPTQWSGVPFAASPPSQALYPPRVALALLAPPSTSLELFVLAHAALGLLGAYRLGRALRLGRAGAAVVGATWLLCGPFLSLQENLPLLAGAAWAPLSLSWLVRLRRRGHGVGRAALGMAAPVLGGDPQTGVALGGLALLLLLTPGAASPRRARALVGVVALSLCLAAPLVVPAVKLLPATDRAALDEGERKAWSLHPIRLSELLVPFPWGLPFPDKRGYAATALAGGAASETWTRSLWVGAAPLVLAALGAVAAAGMLARRLGLSLVVAGLLLAVGDRTPLFDLLGLTPYKVFRYPEKHTLWMALGLAVLAGAGLRRALAARALERRLIVGLALLPSLALLLPAPLARLGDALGRVDGAVVGAGPLTAQGAASASLMLAALALVATRRAPPRARAAGLLALVALGGLPAARRMVFDGPIELAREAPPAAVRLRALTRRRPLPPRFLRWPAGSFGAPVVVGLRPAERAVAAALHSLEGASGARWNLEGVAGMSGFTPRRVGRLLRSAPVTAATRLCAGFVLGPQARAADLAALGPGEDLGGGLRLWPRTARPRVEVLTEVVRAPDDQAAWALLERVGEEVVVVTAASPLPGTVEPTSAPPAAREGGAVLRARRPAPERLELEVRAARPALVVVREAWFPGWTARLDGEARPVLVADGALMAVWVPAGPHTLELTYSTPGLHAGLAAAALGGLAALLLAGRRRARDASPPGATSRRETRRPASGAPSARKRGRPTTCVLTCGHPRGKQRTPARA